MESEDCCQAGNYENRYLWQAYYHSKQHYFTKLLEHKTVSQLTCTSSQMSSSKRVAAVWCCRGAIRQWPSVRDWLLGRDKYTYKKQTKTEVPIFLALKTFWLLRLRNILFAKVKPIEAITFLLQQGISNFSVFLKRSHYPSAAPMN